MYISQESGPVWREFRKICDREDESQSKKIYGMVARYVAVHAKGNPQLLLKPFIGETKQICFKCRGKFPTLVRVKFVSGIIRRVCGSCKEEYEKRGLIKKVFHG